MNEEPIDGVGAPAPTRTRQRGLAKPCSLGACQRVTAEGFLMCKTHWNLVPQPTRRAFFAARDAVREHASAESIDRYHEIGRVAIQEVEAKLGKRLARHQAEGELFNELEERQ